MTSRAPEEREPRDARDEVERRALEALLAAPDEAARAREGLDPAALQALAAGLARAREAMLTRGRLGERREVRFVARVLARTTRQDLSWKGELALWGDFLRARLAASPALRVVAASLVLHLIAAPVVAYWMLRGEPPAKRITIHVEQPSGEPFAPPPPPVEPATDALRAAAHRAEAQRGARARQRYGLQELVARALEVGEGPSDPLAVRLLAARLDARARDSGALLTELASAELDPLAEVLWVELALDHWVLSGERVPGLDPACARLAAALASAAGSSPATAALAGAAVRRARELGRLEGVGPEGAPGWLAPAWFAALAEAGRERGLDGSPAWRAFAALAKE